MNEQLMNDEQTMNEKLMKIEYHQDLRLSRYGDLECKSKAA